MGAVTSQTSCYFQTLPEFPQQLHVMSCNLPASGYDAPVFFVFKGYTPQKLKWQWKDLTVWRCISYWEWCSSIVMLVFGGVSLEVLSNTILKNFVFPPRNWHAPHQGTRESMIFFFPFGGLCNRSLEGKFFNHWTKCWKLVSTNLLTKWWPRQRLCEVLQKHREFSVIECTKDYVAIAQLWNLFWTKREVIWPN